MHSGELIHIVPAVPPAIDGLGSYCYKLWEHWPDPRPQWACLTPNLPAGASELWPQATLRQFEGAEQGLLQGLRELDARNVVLHYVGYGYNPKGCPLWLPRALKKWKRDQGAEGRLTVMFHELYSRGATLSSSRLLFPLSRGIVRNLVGLADAWVTSCPHYHAQLLSETAADESRGAMLPIGADIEPTIPLDWERPWPLVAGRRLKIVLFGQPNTRLWALEAHQNLLRQMCQRDLVEKILLMGRAAQGDTQQETEQLCQTIAPERALWQRRNDLSTEEISAELLGCDLGLVANHAGVLTKSLVYAAFCAHGVIAVATQSETRDSQATLFTAPHLVNDDSAPKVCLENLQNDALVTQTREQIRQMNEHDLDWASITRRWARIVAP